MLLAKSKTMHYISKSTLNLLFPQNHTQNTTSNIIHETFGDSCSYKYDYSLHVPL